MRRSTISTIKSDSYNEKAYMKSLFSHSFGLFMVGFFLTFSWNCYFINLFQNYLIEYYPNILILLIRNGIPLIGSIFSAFHVEKNSINFLRIIILLFFIFSFLHIICFSVLYIFYQKHANIIVFLELSYSGFIVIYQFLGSIALPYYFLIVRESSPVNTTGYSILFSTFMLFLGQVFNLLISNYKADKIYSYDYLLLVTSIIICATAFIFQRIWSIDSFPYLLLNKLKLKTEEELLLLYSNKANVEEEFKHIQKYNYASECKHWSYIKKNSNLRRLIWSFYIMMIICIFNTFFFYCLLYSKSNIFQPSPPKYGNFSIFGWVLLFLNCFFLLFPANYIDKFGRKFTTLFGLIILFLIEASILINIVYCYFFGDLNEFSNTGGLTYYELEIQLILLISIFAFFFEGLGIVLISDIVRGISFCLVFSSKFIFSILFEFPLIFIVDYSKHKSKNAEDILRYSILCIICELIAILLLTSPVIFKIRQSY